jgi:hypothetical protein
LSTIHRNRKPENIMHDTHQLGNAPQKTNGNATLLLHCGANLVERDEVYGIQTPEPTSTWYPLPHREVLGEVTIQLDQGKFQIVSEQDALSHKGARYFGTLAIAHVPGEQEVKPDYGFVVGLRNSHDKSYPAGLVAGTQVFVCDNLCFSGEIKISRKHTRYAARDLRALTARAVGHLGSRFLGLQKRIEAYKCLELDDAAAHDLVIRAVDCRAITTTQVQAVLV